MLKYRNYNRYMYEVEKVFHYGGIQESLNATKNTSRAVTSLVSMLNSESRIYVLTSCLVIIIIVCEIK